MTHLTDEQLVDHFYRDGETKAAALHLHECESCRTRMEQLNAVLNSVDLPVPERPDGYEASVWHNLRGHLPQAEAKQAWWKLPSTWRWGAITAVAALVIGAFLLGRFSQTPTSPVAQAPQQNQLPAPVPQQPEQPQQQQATPQEDVRNVAVKSTQAPPAVKTRDRILVVAVGDHLERSQMVLAELMNADPDQPVDITTQRQIAGELVSENRLYRQAAMRDRNQSLANLLDELERVLVDIAHEPSKLSGPELASVKQRIEAQGIVFKVRVVGSQLRQREQKKPTTLGKST